MAPASIRPLTRRDIPHVVDLYRAVFPANPSVHRRHLETYLAEVFFENPWRDPALPSLVYEDSATGRIAGFLGVLPRPMLCNGRPIRAAVSTSFIVAPSARHTLAAIELLRRFFGGPQDLSLTDAANDASRHIWERLGGVTAILYSLRWTRILRPYGYTMHLAREKRSPLRLLRLPLDPIGRALDTAAGWLRPNRFPQAARSLHSEHPDPDLLLECQRRFWSSERLQPIYAPESFKWLLEMAERKRQYGPLRTRVVRDGRGNPLGWWLYYLQSGGISRVLQLGASGDSAHEVLADLFHDAWRNGSVAISGRLQPRLTQHLSLSHCVLTAATWMLLHARDPHLVEIVCRGDAVLTPLEGEWWTSFLELVPAEDADPLSATDELPPGRAAAIAAPPARRWGHG
jgi:hypothetical protein